MATTLPLGSADRELDDSLRRVRARRRWRVGLHGASTVLATAIALLLVAAAIFAWIGHGTTMVMMVRLVAIVTVALAAWWWLVRPLREHPTDAQIAHFLEDREPSLDAAVLSAVDVRALPATSGTHALDGTLAGEATAPDPDRADSGAPGGAPDATPGRRRRSGNGAGRTPPGSGAR